MRKFRRKLSVERLEGRTLMAADFGIPEVKLYSGDEPAVVGNSLDVADVQGLRGASVQIHFDQERLQVDSKAIRAGTAWDGKGLAIANVNQADGIIKAFVFSVHELDDATGSLIEIDFQPSTPEPPAHAPNATARAVWPVTALTSTPAPPNSPTTPTPNATASAVRPPDSPNATASAVWPVTALTSTPAPPNSPTTPTPDATAPAVRPVTPPTSTPAPLDSPARPSRGFGPPPRAEGESAAIEFIAAETDASVAAAAEPIRDFCVPATPHAPWGIPFPDDWQKKLRSRWGLE